MQYRQKQRNSIAQEPKHVFAAIKPKTAYFKHRKGKTLSFETESSVIYKGSLVTKKEENVVLRKMTLKTAQPSQKLAKPL